MTIPTQYDKQLTVDHSRVVKALIYSYCAFKKINTRKVYTTENAVSLIEASKARLALRHAGYSCNSWRRFIAEVFINVLDNKSDI